MLTLEEFNKIKDGEIFAKGEIENSPEGIYMTDNERGNLLKWVATKGYGDDWTIYCYWAYTSWEFVKKSGQKVYSIENIQKLVPCEKEVMDKYRY